MNNRNKLTMQSIKLKENKHAEKYSVKDHYHQAYQILYVLDNKGELYFDEKKLEFTQDNVAFITPYSNHSITSDAKLTVLVLEFELDKLDPDIQKELQHHLSESRLIELNLFEAGEIRSLLRRMLYEQSQGRPINLLAMKIYLSELLLILIKSNKETEIKDANVLRAERLRKYIDAHYFEVISSNDISQKLGISTRHVNTIFKDYYDVTPMQYLNEVRMEVAKKELIETDKDIVSICFEVGFESLSTFYRVFKNTSNFSPNKFRVANRISDNGKNSNFKTEI